jgi:biopolymer transport protein ExbD
MAEDFSDKLSEGKLDLVPMIDCIMLLLLFFILTTKFTAEEKAIASLLPTDKGQAPTPQTKPVEPPKQINICIFPETMGKGFQPSEYQNKLQALKKDGPGGEILANALMRIGGDEPMMVVGAQMKVRGSLELQKLMDGVHTYIFQALAQRENASAATRKDQDPVVINCFSGLSWKFAIIAYDAVREYEAVKAGSKMASDPKMWGQAREIEFAPPRIRNYSAKELGEELYEIVNMQ